MLLRMLIVDLVLTLFIVLFLQPTNKVPFAEYLVVVLGSEVITSGVAFFFRKSDAAYLIVQTVLMSAILAVIFVLWLRPAPDIGYDQAFLYVFTIQASGLAASYVLVRQMDRR